MAPVHVGKRCGMASSSMASSHESFRCANLKLAPCELAWRGGIGTHAYIHIHTHTYTYIGPRIKYEPRTQNDTPARVGSTVGTEIWSRRWRPPRLHIRRGRICVWSGGGPNLPNVKGVLQYKHSQLSSSLRLLVLPKEYVGIENNQN